MRAAADGKLWVMERGVYTAIKLSYQQQLAAEKRALVLRVPLLAVLAPVSKPSSLRLRTSESLWAFISVQP